MMRKRSHSLLIIILAILAMVNTNVFAQSNNQGETSIIIFSDSKVKTICISNWDTDGDGELSELEAAAVTSLGDVFKKSAIDTFDELRFFTGLTSIGSNAFENSTVKSLLLPESITSLDNYAFLNCMSLTTINLPAALQTVGKGALSGCTAMTSITVDESNTSYCSVDGVLFSKDKTILVQYPAAKGTEYTVPEGTIVIGMDAFFMSKLSSVTLPSTLTELAFDAFGYSSNITEFVIPEGVTSIGDYAFDHCTKLQSLHLPSSLNSIGQRICNSVNAITDVNSAIKEPFDINTNNFTSTVYSNAILHVPSGKKNAYAGKSGWGSFNQIVEEIVVINFNDSKTKAICVSSWDTDGDGELSESEAAAVTSLGTAFKKSAIDTFDELRFFTGLTSIGSNAFENSTVKSLLLPETVSTLGDYAFLNCMSLTEINFPAALQTVGKGALSGCTAMTSITVAESNTSYCSVDGVLFNKDKKQLIQYPAAKGTEYTVPEGTTVIGQDAFFMSKLSSVVLPSTLTELAFDAFGYCSNIIELVIPEGVTSVGDYAFDHCTKLETLHLPSSLTVIGSRLCNGNNAITDVYSDIVEPFGINDNSFSTTVYQNALLHVPAGTIHSYKNSEGWKNFQKIEDNAVKITFADSKVKAICVSNWDTDGDGELSEPEAAAVSTLGTAFKNSAIDTFNELRYFTGLTSISGNAFANSTVKSITLPENITSLEAGALLYCTQLTVIHLPASVQVLGKNALSGCTAMTSITVDEANSEYSSVDGVLFSKDKTILVQYPAAKGTEYTVPEGTLVIGEDAFFMSKLSSVTLPSTLTELAFDAFGECRNMTDITIPEGVSTIGNHAFSQCANLKTIHIPSSVVSIGENMCKSCNSLTEIYSAIAVPFGINDNCFPSTVYQNALLYVPAGTILSYKNSEGWKNFKKMQDDATKIAFTDSKVKAICVSNWDTDGDGELSEQEAAAVSTLGTAFKDSAIDTFNELSYFTGLTSISEKAFANSTVRAITLPGNISSIGAGAFLYCMQLTTINLPAAVQDLGQGALSGCTAMTSITVDELNAFYCSVDGVLFSKDKERLILYPAAKGTDYTVPEGTVEIGRDAFFMSNLYNVSLPSTLTKLDFDAFGYCSNITEFVIPEGVTSIGDYAFDHCTKLKTLHFPNSLSSIGSLICNGNNAITDVYSDIVQPFGINDNCFPSTVYQNASLHVPAGTILSYKNSEGWKNFQKMQDDAAKIAFSDSKVKTICVSNWDTDGDGELSEEEAAAVSTLGTAFKNSAIDTFNELRYFTGLTGIDENAFANSTVRTITLPGNISFLGENAFLYCLQLTTINLPAAVETLGQNALSGCTSMTSITVDESNTSYCSVDGVLFSKDRQCLVQYPAAKGTEYTVPEGTTVIGRDAFFMSKLSSVVLSSSLTELAFDAFGECRNFSEVAIPEGVTTIGDYAFTQCEKLKSIHIPSSVNSIGEYMCKSCHSLADVYSDIAEPFGINDNCFPSSAYQNAVLHVPAGKKAIYSTTAGWSKFQSIVAPKMSYPLSIQSSEGGSVVYNENSITNEVKTFSVVEGDTIILGFAPEQGYELSSLTYNGSNVTSSVVDGKYDIEGVSSNTSIIAQFSKIKYSLSINSSGEGLVQYNSSSIENSTQSFSIEHGTSVTLTLTPKNGNMLSSLSVNGTSVLNQIQDGKYTISNITTNMSVVAVFDPIPAKTYTLSIQSTEGGSVVYNGVNVTNDVQYFTVSEGASFTISTTPDNGYELSSLTVNNSDVTAMVVDGQYEISNVSDNVTVSAAYKKRTFNLSIEASGNGTVLYNSTPIVNTSNSFSVTYGSTETITISPDPGYQISSVTFNGANVTANVTDNTYTISRITSNNILKVVFEPIPEKSYNLVILSSFGGNVVYNGASISASTRTFSVNEGGSVELGINPDQGYELSRLTLNGADMTGGVIDGKYVIEDVRQNVNIEVHFVMKSFDLTINASGNGYVRYGSDNLSNTTQSYTVDYDKSASLEIVPDNGYQLSSLMVNGKDMTAAVTNNVFTIANISSDQDVKVNFEIIPAKTYVLTLGVSSGGTAIYKGVEVTGTSREFIINEGASVNLDVIPALGYRLKALTVGDMDLTSRVKDNTFTLDNINSETTINVEFETIPLQKFTVDVTVSKGGNVEYNGSSISNGSRSFTLDEGASLSMTVLPNLQYRLGKFSVNGVDMTSSVIDNNYNINNVADNIRIDVVFDMIMEDFVVNQVKYGIVSADFQNVEVRVNDYSGHVIIPSSVQYNGMEWNVTEIADQAFKGSSQLISISIPSTIEKCGKGIFLECERLSAIIWNPQLQLTNSQCGDIENRNLLFYTSSEDYAPRSVENIVVNNHASKIGLIEYNEFYCPQTFTADKITFKHHYSMQTGIGESRGWETLVLPFNVQKITHEKKGEIAPFAAYDATSSTHPFWLYGYDPVQGFVESSSIMANRPYIISMPNNSQYAEEYNLSGNVEFSSENISIEATVDLQNVVCGDNMFCPTYSVTSKNVKALNVNNDYVSYTGGLKPGSTFIFGIREARPFEAYMTSASGNMSPVAIFDDPTAIKSLPVTDSPMGRIIVYSTSGQVVKISDALDKDNVLKNLAPGVYIVNGQKFIVR